ncbi:Inner membrane protein YbaN [Paraliobacillus sp. PM-2]|uniref:YbaN family protein n=1 Tax=Paraliobacillus sp. PM-2 TaxID=1462524 RepID=UPI00061C41E5|nr:YbaN family protein [Paraliobacillus sp. PM-2]CQR47306.1 Inner membrane protein YbaN [Paraliobacillus sp. PM-2]
MIQFVKKAIYILFGFIFMIIGFLGVVLPLLPSIPFLILASVCFFRGSDRLDSWFKGTRLYQNQVEPFLRERALTLKKKIWINIMADSMILISIFIVEYIWLKMLLILIALYKHYYFVFHIRTIK